MAFDQVGKTLKTDSDEQIHHKGNTKHTKHQTSVNSTALFSQFEHSNYEEEQGVEELISKAASYRGINKQSAGLENDTNNNKMELKNI